MTDVFAFEELLCVFVCYLSLLIRNDSNLTIGVNVSMSGCLFVCWLHGTREMLSPPTHNPQRINSKDNACTNVQYPNVNVHDDNCISSILNKKSPELPSWLKTCQTSSCDSHESIRYIRLNNKQDYIRQSSESANKSEATNASVHAAAAMEEF